MRKFVVLLFVLSIANCWARDVRTERMEAEYYAAAYARLYGVPLDFVRAIIEQESGWQRCAVSSKGAVGLMQLMPETARQLGVRNRCDAKENISGGVRYIALLMNRFGGDLRLVAAAYYAGSIPIAKRKLNYSNRDVVAYVASVRVRVERQRRQQISTIVPTRRPR